MLRVMLVAMLVSLMDASLLRGALTNVPAIPETTNVSPAISASTERTEILETGTVIYGKGGDHDLHALICAPKESTAPVPAIIYIHGGGWMAGSNREGPVEQIAQHGYFAASIEYRLTNVAKWPAQIEDCKCAVRWLRANAAQYHVDPNRIGVWGASAGGHLAACLGTMADQPQFEGNGGNSGVSSAVQAVVDYFGPTNFQLVGNVSPVVAKILVDFFGVPREQNPELWRSGSPYFFVKAGDPPFLIVQGDSDTLVSPIQSTLLAEALAKADVPHQLIMVKNAGHGFAPMNGKAIEPSLENIGKSVYAFFDQYLKP